VYRPTVGKSFAVLEIILPNPTVRERMTFDPDLSPIAWAALHILRNSTLEQAPSQAGTDALAELSEAGFVKDGKITAKGKAAARRRSRLGVALR